MRHLKVFDLNLAEFVSRFYFMMAVVIITGFLGSFTLAAIIGMLVAITWILGTSFRKELPRQKANRLLDTKPGTAEARKAA